MSKESSSSSGMGCGTVVQIVLIILKLTSLIDWPWSVVLIPTWAGIAFGILFGLLLLLFR